MKILKVKTIAIAGCFRAIAKVFESLPAEEAMYGALYGTDLTRFRQYLADNARERGEYDYNWMPAEVTYSTGKDEEGNEYIKEIQFVTPTSERVITISEDEDESMRFTITIDFNGSKTAAHEVLSGIKLGSYADESTQITWIDGTESSLMDYQVDIYDKLRFRRLSRWSCHKYDDYTNGWNILTLLSAAPSISLDEQGEYLTEKLDFTGDVLDYILHFKDRTHHRVTIKVDDQLYDKVMEFISQTQISASVIKTEGLTHGEPATIFSGDKSPMTVLYLKD
ncbi:hypothetical protein [Paenibacillus lutrae]|uniref:Uncharacterized protein n=1 Tax=Paenibacillus lutrae TaxID=2078573 RepID=A0A7X3FLY7_9BACL|nr:hypothetical protein [Paenibacillus lutrae]MVP02085.1 hypothetical protein [Paenibacillus lutrae]